MKRWQGILLAGAGAGVASIAALVRRMNNVESIDPAALVLPLPENHPPSAVMLESVDNFRDAGGYRTADGGRVRTGLIYRSGALHNLSERDLATLRDLNIKLVCDLRSENERNAEPDTLPTDPAPTYLHLPLNTEDDRRQRLMAILFNRRRLAQMMRQFYIEVVIDQNARLYGDILRRFADPANLPAILHCTAGKDRTGIGVALLLSLLGVPDDIIIADYSLSNRYYDKYLEFGRRAVQPLAWLRVKAEDLQPLFLADPANLRAALDQVRQQYGGIERYLREKAGVDDATQARLRELLVEQD
ncbi:MAG: tyrosine-protein phosphatase [Anaerolineae bacterium]